MKSAFVFLSLLLIFTFNYAYAQEPIIMEQVTSNGKVKVQLIWPEVLPGGLYDIELRFLNPQTNETITDYIMYNFAVTQNEQTIEFYEGESTEDGKSILGVVFPVNGTGPAQVIVLITRIGSETTYTEMDEKVVFNVQVVPEFSAMTATVMALSMLIIVMLKLLGKTVLNMN